MSINNDDITPSNVSQTDNEIRELTINEDLQEEKQNNLNKHFGVLYGIGMNVNTIIGSGIVTTPGIIWNMVKSPVVVLSLWFICGIVSMAGTLSYVELGVIHKISGGETKYLQTAYPHPKIMMSYLFSFMYIFAIQPGIISAVLQSAAQYFWYTLNGHQYNEGIKDTNKTGWELPFTPFWSIKLLAITFLLIITAYHMFNTRLAVIINHTLAVIKLITYSIIAMAGIYRLIVYWPISRINWQNSLNGNSDITAYSASILLIMFSYSGYNSLNYSLSEVRKLEKKLIISNSTSIGIVILVYLLVNIAFISVVPANDILDSDISSDETIAVIFFSKLFGKSDVTIRIFTALIALSIIGTAATGVWNGTKVIVAAAGLNYFPKYSKELRTLNDKYNTLVNALLMHYWIFYFATGIGLLKIRHKNSDRSSKKEYQVPSLLLGIFILAGLIILTFSFIVHVECPKKNPHCSDEYLRKQRIEQMSPILISYAFLFIALLFWYFFYYWWNTLKKQKESIIRISTDK
ncbi:amino acid permease-domain-containing protein [Glomus cerebriforme]|uniref:Amino acid permease-domain-containing protein n=1 Tax=Glomus cerebriforme TaxID=658196 RepID=A0A397T5L5_9GLOM|nr:amino acid permease-domain-containing protein [Glomus cerebriforme]